MMLFLWAAVICSVFAPSLGMTRTRELNGMFRIEHRSGKIFDPERICAMFCNNTSDDNDYDYFHQPWDYLRAQPRIFCALCKKKGFTESTTMSPSTTPMTSSSTSSSTTSSPMTSSSSSSSSTQVTTPTTTSTTSSPTTTTTTSSPTTTTTTTSPTP